MSKYTEQFKLAIVGEYLSGSINLYAIAQQHGLCPSTLRRWVALHRLHGENGLKKKYGHYSAKFKLSVLQHMWEHALSYRETAVVFNIGNHSILQAWERRYHSGGIEALVPHPRGRPKKMSIPKPAEPQPSSEDDKRTREELLAEVNYLRMENAYLKKLKALVQAQQQAAAHKKRK